MSSKRARKIVKKKRETVAVTPKPKKISLEEGVELCINKVREASRINNSTAPLPAASSSSSSTSKQKPSHVEKDSVLDMISLHYGMITSSTIALQSEDVDKIPSWGSYSPCPSHRRNPRALEKVHLAIGTYLELALGKDVEESQIVHYLSADTTSNLEYLEEEVNIFVHNTNDMQGIAYKVVNQPYKLYLIMRRHDRVMTDFFYFSILK
jgi:hypothetical protein